MRRDGLEPLGDAETSCKRGICRTEAIRRSRVRNPRCLAAPKSDVRMKMNSADAQGMLQKYAPGVPIRSGAVVLMPSR